MSARIVILGGGTGGTILANRLARRLKGEAAVTVVDANDTHLYQPGLLFVPFRMQEPADIVRPRHRQLLPGIRFLQASVDRVDTAHSRVFLLGPEPLDYDVLVIASGVDLLPQETEGMLGPGWRESVFDFYSLDGATALRDRLDSWTGGRLVVNVVDMPIKCPVAPLEFAFLADWYLTERGVRDKTEIVFATPLDGAFTRPIARQVLGDLLKSKQIRVEPEFAAGEVDGSAGRLRSFDGRELAFDLLVTTPVHGGAAYVGRSPGLGDELGFVPTDLHTLAHPTAPGVFALGDATNLPTSKAGSVTHFEAEILTENIARYLRGEPPTGSYDGHANCFIESGFGKALLIDFNYETEPLPGNFPLAGIGPMSLLAESRLNHWGKLMFHWFYWNVLLPGRSVPFMGAPMSMSGKHRPPGPQ